MSRTALLLVLLASCAGPQRSPLRVFLLAGQSNMEGKGAVNTLAHLGDDPEHGPLLAELRTTGGEWVVRDDVWIWFLGRKGGLTVGYGSTDGAHGAMIGPELGFGTVVGDAFDEPVLLIKTAWGGKDLANDFLPPGAGGPGPYYTGMVEHVRRVLADLEELFPECDGRGYELSGLVWFQGWNDMVDESKTAAYAERLAQLIRDLRADLDAPELAVVIGELGVGGPEPAPNVARFRAEQRAAAERAEFEGSVLFVPTSPHYDLTAHALYEADVWKGPDKERFYAVASDRPYHYLGSAKVYYLMGRSLGRGMLELLP